MPLTRWAWSMLWRAAYLDLALLRKMHLPRKPAGLRKLGSCRAGLEAPEATAVLGLDTKMLCVLCTRST